MTRILIESRGPVGTITLARPEKKNALDRQTAEELQGAFDKLGADAAVRAIVLTAQGDDFCAGADLQALEQMLAEGIKAHLQDAQALGKVFITMRTVQKPVIGVVRGRALAGGAGLANACDIVLAHADAVFGYPEVQVGFVPAMVMTMLRRSVGEKRAFDLIATGRRVSAVEAMEMGLVSRVMPAATFDTDVETVIQGLATSPPTALGITKRLFYGLDGLDFREGIALGAKTNVEARSTEDFREGIKRFAGRQRP
jgi:methylglutaconyl-CoA hydratase